MKIQSHEHSRRFELKILGYGNGYYIERVARLERALARKPRVLQIDLIGQGEVPADVALLIRSILLARSSRTEIVTNARSSLQNGSVLVWLLGDRRIIRDDARVFFRRATLVSLLVSHCPLQQVKYLGDGRFAPECRTRSACRCPPISPRSP
jgi:hypothetical protein